MDRTCNSAPVLTLCLPGMCIVNICTFCNIAENLYEELHEMHFVVHGSIQTVILYIAGTDRAALAGSRNSWPTTCADTSCSTKGSWTFGVAICASIHIGWPSICDSNISKHMESMFEKVRCPILWRPRTLWCVLDALIRWFAKPSFRVSFSNPMASRIYTDHRRTVTRSNGYAGQHPKAVQGWESFAWRICSDSCLWHGYDEAE